MSRESRWSQMIDAAECDYLGEPDLEALQSYAASFALRIGLYQRIKERELDWVGSVLRQLGHSSQGDLSATAILLAQALAAHLRDMALEILRGDASIEVPAGMLESSLPLTSAWRYLYQLMQQDLSSAEQALVEPHWVKRSDRFQPPETSGSQELEISDPVEPLTETKHQLSPEIEAELITLTEMFS